MGRPENGLYYETRKSADEGTGGTIVTQARSEMNYRTRCDNEFQEKADGVIIGPPTITEARSVIENRDEPSR